MKTAQRGKAKAKKTISAGQQRPSENGYAMAVVIRNVPPGHDWGWYSREDPRMHLQTVDDKHRNLYKVWLEATGQRVLEPAGKIPAKILKKLAAHLARWRDSVEAQWVNLMIRLGWLRCIFRNPIITLTAYPALPHRFDRTIDIADDFAPEFVARLGPNDVRLNDEFAVIELEPQRPEGQRLWISLPEVLWPK